MTRAGRPHPRQRELLREDLLAQGHTRAQIAAAMTHQFSDRPRAAWRYAHGWSQDHVAHLFNELLDDEQASMTGNRIGGYERWPRKGGLKPTIYTLAILAKIYDTRTVDLVDPYDRQKMSARDRLVLGVIDSVIVPHQIPGTIANFVGRTHELEVLTAQLDRVAAEATAVIITAIGGTAGIGKTTLALHWARMHRDRFPEGQLYVDLRGFDPSGVPMTPQEAVRSFLDAFQVPAYKIPVSFESQLGLYRSLVEDKRLLIILDNARDADQILRLLPGSPRCLVLVTSRQQLGSLIALRRAIHITVELLSAEESRQLLAEFLGAQRTQAEPQAVTELIQHCARLPIALTIAAARILANPHLPLAVLVEQLREQRQRLDTLSTGDSQLTNIRGVFSWSYTALSPQAARLFRLLGLHPGPDIDLYAAASLAGLSEQDTRRQLTELAQAHLLRENKPGRYQFHDLLRAYAAEQAANEEPEPERRVALHRVLDYYLHTGVLGNQYLAPTRIPVVLATPQSGVILSQITDYEQALDWFTRERIVLLATISYAGTHDFDTHAWQLPWTLSTFLYRRGYWHDYIATQQIALVAGGRLGNHTVEALAYCELGHAYTQLGRYVDARAYLQYALTSYQELNDDTGQARTHHAFGWLCERQSEYSQALTHTHQALDLYRATGHRIGEARALNNLGWYHTRIGCCVDALTDLQQALGLNRELGDRYGEASTLDSLGYTHHCLGQYGQALTYYHQALALRREFGAVYNEADTLTHIGDAHYAAGSFDAAHTTWQQALALLEQLGHPDADVVRVKLHESGDR